MEENFDLFLKLIDDLASIKVTISDEDQAIQLLSSLPQAYEPLVHTLQYGTGKDTLTISEVMASAYSKEVELKQKGLATKGRQSEGLYTEARGRTSTRSSGGGNKPWQNRNKGKARSKSRSRPTGKSDKTCWICGSDSHWKRDCPEKRDNAQQSKGTTSVNVAQNLPGPLVLTASLYVSEDEWVMDSGCTFHITPRRELLSNFVEMSGNKVMMGNNSFCMVKGMGNITIDSSDGSVIVLKDVRYIPDMGRNLISYGQLENSGCSYNGKDHKIEFFKEGKKVLTGVYTNGLYYLQGKVRRAGEANVTEEAEDKTKKWHSRLAHMNTRSMQLLVRRGYLGDKEIGKLEFCEGCAMGKSHKQKFPKAKHYSKEVLEYIHTDLWGSPNTVSSLAGAHYFLTFTDDYSKKVWIYFLKTKDEVFHWFAEWKLLVENQTGRKIKCLRTDNGLEFCNRQMDSLCRESGIKRHKTCSYTPQQNGISERMNRSIMDKVRAMLVETGLEGSYWAEAASTTVYLINRSPNSSIDFEIPEERWTGARPNYDHLKSFGCIAYVHQVKEKTSPRAVKGVFMGYAQGIKGYRVWLLDEEKIVISKDVVFDETKFFKDIKKEESPPKEKAKAATAKKVTFSSNLEDFYEGEGSNGGGAITENVEEEAEEDSAEASETDESTGLSEETAAEIGTYCLARDRERRTIRPPSKFEDADFLAYALASAEDLETEEPKSYKEAMESRDRELWIGASDEEMDSLEKNHTWDYAERPKDCKVIGCKWLYKIKPGIPGVEDPRYKGRLVAKGYAQTEGVDYNEVFAPVVKHVSIRLMLSAVVQHDLELEQLDVKTAFLHRVLKERVFMEQPEGYIKKGKEKWFVS